MDTGVQEGGGEPTGVDAVNGMIRFVTDTQCVL
jgi:hypothetical protein